MTDNKNTSEIAPHMSPAPPRYGHVHESCSARRLRLRCVVCSNYTIDYRIWNVEYRIQMYIYTIYIYVYYIYIYIYLHIYPWMTCGGATH